MWAQEIFHAVLFMSSARALAVPDQLVGRRGTGVPDTGSGAGVRRVRCLLLDLIVVTRVGASID